MTRHTSHRSADLQECIDVCTQCHAICIETASHALRKGGKHALAEHVDLLQACADICATSADTMLRGVDVHRHTCAACAEICRRCADACEQMAAGDEQMRRCAEICRQCAESCSRMAA